MIPKLIALLFFSVASLSLQISNDPEIPKDVKKRLSRYSCSSCHHISKNRIGPSWLSIAELGYSAKRIEELIAIPEPSNWPNYQPMAGQPDIPAKDLKIMSEWLSKLRTETK